MHNQSPQQFCPLYREATQKSPWQNAPNAHTGLLFDKFPDAWQVENRKWLFDDGVGKDKKDRGRWLKTIASRAIPAAPLTEAAERQRNLALALGGKTLILKNTTRFVTGLGREHPLENGFAWHHTLGTPYLPASSLKGMLRAWLRETEGEIKPPNRNHKDPWLREDPTFECWFGTGERAGRFTLLDLIPLKAPTLAVEVMTPHYGPYYQGKEAPGDWHDPVPITYLAVEADNSWQTAIIPGTTSTRTITPEERDQLSHHLILALESFGAGAKTATGYGRFQRDTDAEEKLHKEAEKRAAEEREKKKLEEETIGMSPIATELFREARDKGWDHDQTAFTKEGVVEAWLERLEADPQPDAIRFLEKYVRKHFRKGLLENPEKTKKKGKAEFSKRQQAFAKRLIQLISAHCS